ncbi:NACHT domain-containing protein [Salinibacillus kushneri]|uniref:NACHT domain-containing protein n=1 Tax=Salinibacillus kushneri TaxID=237682 RepID=A0A1I0HD48_9BACI|nr:NACHT domain-containing protein [Salinibacillus kushneri]SET80793.1 NACHT domain-containing protein [Salinibacillus kushneri]
MNDLDFNKIISDLVQKNIKSIGNNVFNKSKDVYQNFITQSSIAFKNYLEFSVKKYSYIKTILYKDSPVFLYDFYVHTNLKYKNEILKVENIDELLDENRFLVITGTAGAGKSTLMKFLFLNTIKTKYSIPLFIELRNFNNSDLSFEDSIYNILKTSGFDLEKKFFLEALKSGKFTFFFDGFDELDYHVKDRITKELHDLCDEYHENNFIVSSRPDSSFISWNYFSEMKILPLNKEQSIQLVSKLDYDKKTKDKFISELGIKLYKEHSSFVSNPLLLTIMLMTYNQFAEIPDKMHLFYEQAFDTLYSKHDATKTGYKRLMNSRLAKDDFEKVLSCFSCISYLKGDYSFDISKLNNYLSQAKEITGIEFDQQGYITDLTKSVCLLLKDGFIYTFSHKTFQEYFTAKFIISLEDEVLNSFSSEVLKKSNTDKVLELMFDLNQDKVEKNFIIPILEEIERDFDYKNNTKLENYRNYLMLIFKSFDVHLYPISPEDDSKVSLSFIDNKESNYDKARSFKNALEFIYKQYPDISLRINKSNNENTNKYATPNNYIIEKYKEYIIESEGPITTYDIGILKYDEVFYDLFSESDGLAIPFYKSMEYLTIIKSQLNKKKVDIIELLKK